MPRGQVCRRGLEGDEEVPSRPIEGRPSVRKGPHFRGANLAGGSPGPACRETSCRVSTRPSCASCRGADFCRRGPSTWSRLYNFYTEPWHEEALVLQMTSGGSSEHYCLCAQK